MCFYRTNWMDSAGWAGGQSPGACLGMHCGQGAAASVLLCGRNAASCILGCRVMQGGQPAFSCSKVPVRQHTSGMQASTIVGCHAMMPHDGLSRQQAAPSSHRHAAAVMQPWPRCCPRRSSTRCSLPDLATQRCLSLRCSSAFFLKAGGGTPGLTWPGAGASQSL